MTSRLLIVAGLLILPATAAAVQTNVPGATPDTTAATRGPDPAKVDSALARADLATFSGKTLEARRIYRQIISQQERADQFAGAAMWRLALNYLYADEPRRAAEMLDDLAEAARRYGDPTVQLRATFEAAVLWNALKRPELVPERLDRARALLQSPVIPESEKILIKSRMG
jgi:hypothetical protein